MREERYGRNAGRRRRNDGDDRLYGTININLPIKDYPFEDIALQAVADAYEEKHPETTVKVEGQTSSTYKDWLDSQFAGGASVTDADTVRSVGGAVGWYGVVKKDKKQNDLVMDFMMFWGSKEGQDIYNESLKQQGAFISGNSLVKEVDTPVEIYPAKDYEFPGLCHNNPVGQFFGNLCSMNGPTYQTFEALCKNMFNGDITVQKKFGEQLTKAFQNDIPDCFKQLGWKSDAYLTPEMDPNL